MGALTHNTVLQLTDPTCHVPGGCNRTAQVVIPVSASIDSGVCLTSQDRARPARS